MIDKLNDLVDWEFVKKNIRVRAVPEHTHLDAISNVIGDIRLIMYVIIEERRNQLVSAPVNEPLLTAWGIDSQEVWSTAWGNMTDGVMGELRHVIYGGSLVSINTDMDLSDAFAVTVTNKSIRNGAAIIFNPEVAARMCVLMKTDGIYIVPMSVHDCVVHPLSYPLDAIQECLIGTVQHATREDEFLSYKVYQYNLADNQFREAG